MTARGQRQRLMLTATALLLLIPASGNAQPTRRAFTVDPGAELMVTNVAGAVTVTRGPAGEMTVEAETHGDAEARARVDIEMTQQGNRVEIRTRHTRGDGRARVTYDIRVPSDTAVSVTNVSGDVGVETVDGEIRVETVSGGIRIDRAGDLVVAKSVSGAVELSAAGAARELRVESVSGAIALTDVDTPRLALSTVSGDVDVERLSSDAVDIRSVSGAVAYAGPLAADGRYRLTTHSGDLEVMVGDTAGFVLEARSFSGRIVTETQFGLGDGRTGRGPGRTVAGTYGDGGARLELTTFSGDVAVTSTPAQ